LTLGTWGATTDGAPPDDAAASAPRPPLPANTKAGDYVRAVAKLYQEGQIDKIGPYYQAAVTYRDLLTPDEAATLDQYAQLLSSAGPAPATAEVPPAQPALGAQGSREKAIELVSAARAALQAGEVEQARQYATQADALQAPFSPEEDNPRQVLAEIAKITSGPSGLGGRATPNNPKQQSVWLLRQAREQIGLKNFEAAEAFIAQAEALGLRYTLFDDTPAKVRDDLAKARAEAGPSVAAAPGDKKTAHARLKEARLALEQGDYRKAHAIAVEVNGWGLHFNALEDSPQKVAAAAVALQRREVARNAGARQQPNPDVYNLLVAEARTLMSQGDLAGAEQRALQAQQSGVVPAVTADRAESVLHDLAMLRARQDAPAPAGAAPAAPQGERPSTVAEREADRLLAAQQYEAATAKFAEAERLRAQEEGTATSLDPVALNATPAVADPALVRTDGAQADPFGADPAAPAAPAADPFGAEAPGAPPADPFAGVAPAPLGGADPAAPAAPAGDALAQAQALLAAGNYRAAREAAQAAKAQGAGLEADNLLAQIEQTRQQAAYLLYESALKSLREGQVERSRLILGELSESDLDEGMAQKVQDLLIKLPSDPAGHAEVGLGVGEDVEVVKAQQLNAEISMKVGEARTLMETDPAKAIALLEQTLAAVKAAGLSESVTRGMVQRLNVNIELAKKDKVTFDQKMQDKAYREEIERKRLRIIEADKAKKERIKEFMDKAMEAQANGDWVNMEKFAQMAAKIDPNLLEATTAVTMARMHRNSERYLSNKEAKEQGFLELMHDVDESSIVSADALKRGVDMPRDFADLTARRQALAARLNPGYKSAKALEIEKALDKTITLPSSDRMTLGESLRYLREYTGLNIVPDHSALSEEGVTLETPITLTEVNNVKLKTVLKLMLSQLHLSYEISDDVLMVTTPQANRSRMITRVYSVADLVIAPQDRNNDAMFGPNSNFVAPPGMNGPIRDGQPIGAEALGVQAAAMSGNAAAGMSFPAPDGQGVKNYERKPEFEPLIQLIKTSIAPGTWNHDHTPLDEINAYGQGAGFGGDDEEPEGVGSITPFYLNISLIIRQTAEVHDEIVDLLRQLRRLQDLQVSIEVRFISVSDSFFEQIGVDFDFFIQSDAVGQKSSLFVPNPAANQASWQPPGGGTTGTTAGGGTAVAPYLINPARDHAIGRAPVVVGTNAPTNDPSAPQIAPGLQIPFIQSTIDAAENVFNAVPNLGGTFGIAFLSDLEVYLFLQAIQGDVRSNLVQAPKVTSFNGAPASVINFTGRNFVQQLTPIIGAGAVAFQPQIQTFPDGVQMFVTPVVSADRRYVRMSMSPFFTTFLGFDTFEIPAAVGGGGLGGQSSTINARVQLPQFSITNVSTTVTVPDGGTVLLGGVKRLREVRNEFGVPILSKTPLIDRLFRNVGIGRQTDSLMLMVTPRIIILEEEEERLGIPAVQNFTF
jgi:type II secretory pathway component GspD/PulD (secretin)